jgi:uncharacterized protein (DUF58 family)
VSLLGPRGPTALLLGAVAYAASWAFGSRPLAVVGIGLALAGILALVWARWARGPLRLTATVAPAPAIEGDDLSLELELTRRRAVPLASFSVQARWPRLGERRIALRGAGRILRGSVVLTGVPRGVHRLELLEVTHEDPLGLERIVQPLQAPRPLVVRPRVVTLDALFAEGVLEGAAARVRRSRHGAADLRSVRPHREGEALRGVHWPTTARRGSFMLKELEDATGGETVVLLDCDPLGMLGEHSDTPFDAAVRAAGSIAVTFARRGRSALLLTTGRHGWTVRVAPRALDDALDALAAAEADAPVPLAAVLERPHGTVAAARELVVVTARLDAPTVAALRPRASALVWVDASSWAGRARATSPGLLSLAAAGIPVTTLRRGDDLAAVLAPARRHDVRAHG